MLKWLGRVLGFGAEAGPSRRALGWRVQAPDPAVRRHAAEQLATVAEPWACDLLLVLFKDLIADVRTAAKVALQQKGTAATAVLIKALEDGDPKVALPAAELLGASKDLDAVRPLLLVMKFGTTEVRAAATRALVSYGKAAIPGLMLACEDPDPWTRTRGDEILSAIRAAESAAPPA